MPWPVFFTAIGLLLVFEGLLPFLSPRFWRGIIQQISLQSDQALRAMGLVSMIIGVSLIYIARWLYR